MSGKLLEGLKKTQKEKSCASRDLPNIYHNIWNVNSPQTWNTLHSNGWNASL